LFREYLSIGHRIGCSTQLLSCLFAYSPTDLVGTRQRRSRCAPVVGGSRIPGRTAAEQLAPRFPEGGATSQAIPLRRTLADRLATSVERAKSPVHALIGPNGAGDTMFNPVGHVATRAPFASTAAITDRRIEARAGLARSFQIAALRDGHR
jgi:hypothetical protein